VELQTSALILAVLPAVTNLFTTTEEICGKGSPHMAEQVLDQQRRYGDPTRHHVVLGGLAIVSLIAVAGVWVANLEDGLSAVLSVIFTLLGVLLGLLPWLPLPWRQQGHLLPGAMPVTGQHEHQSCRDVDGPASEVSQRKGTLIVTVHTDAQELVTKVSIVARKLEEGNRP
jgi:hypothetical protein